VDTFLCHLFHAGDGALGIFLIVEGDNLDVVGLVAICTPPFSFSQAASVSIERTFDVPQAAAGPLVTPTNPTFSVSFSALAAPPIPRMAAVTPAAAMDLRRLRRYIGSAP
jgi:hypothetical protein